MVVLYGRAGRLTAQNGGFRPGQYMNFTAVHADGELDAELAAAIARIE